MDSTKKDNWNIVLLSESIREKFNEIDYPEASQKDRRPHLALEIKLDNEVTAFVPFRTHLNHGYGFKTDPVRGSGLDYSKTMMITDNEEVSKCTPAKIRPNEYEYLVQNTNPYRIKRGLINYIDKYKRAYIEKIIEPNEKPSNILSYSTLQYFHNEIALDKQVQEVMAAINKGNDNEQNKGNSNNENESNNDLSNDIPVNDNEQSKDTPIENQNTKDNNLENKDKPSNDEQSINNDIPKDKPLNDNTENNNKTTEVKEDVKTYGQKVESPVKKKPAITFSSGLNYSKDKGRER